MLCRPYLALSTDRRISPKTHPTSGSPEDWFSNDVLDHAGLFGVTFDFFVDWQTGRLCPELWVKRIVKQDFQPWPSADCGLLQQLIEACDGAALFRLAAFAGQRGLNVTYQLFKDTYHWHDGKTLVSAALDGAGRVGRAEIKPVADLKREIQAHSGGPVRLGRKGLVYSTSTLESYLSHTDALWPGDADLLLLDDSETPRGLLEFKKHSLETPMSGQQLSNYYPHSDRRKYDRLAILRDFLDPALPFLILYYPTSPLHRSVVLERVEGLPGNLRSAQRAECPLPQGPLDGREVLRRALSML
jgi:hypothetical protein